jgi:hypothetical protein
MSDKPEFSTDELTIISIALRKSARTSHPLLATLQRALAHRIAAFIPPPFEKEESDE